MSIEQTPRVAVVGAGHWGKNLVRNLHALGALAAICESDPRRRTELAARYPDVEITENYAALLQNPALPGIVLATPAATHYEMARQALLAGKDVFVEKPLCLHPAQGEELCRLAGQHDRILMVGHLLHYHPAVQVLKEMVAAGRPGKIHHIYSHRLGLGIFRSEENVLFSFAPHDISVILALAGGPPRRVRALGTSTLRPEIADTVHLDLQFAGGLVAHIFVSWLHPFKEQRLVVVGEKGMLVFNDTAPEDKLLYYPDPVAWPGGVPVPQKQPPRVLPYPDGEPLRAECATFLQAVATRQAPPTDGAEGLRVLAVLTAAQKSLQQGGEWVEVDLTPGTTAPPPEYFAHPSAVIDEGCRIGPGTKIWHFSHIMSGAELGENCNIGQNVVVSPGVKLGRNVKVQNNVSVYSGVTCEDDVFLGPSMVFTNVKTPRSHISRRHQYTPTLIKKGASIGANATIVCGVTIGRYALVGAGAVVTRDVPDHAVVYGNPARLMGWVCKCGEKIVGPGEEKVEECEKCGGKMQH